MVVVEFRDTGTGASTSGAGETLYKFFKGGLIGLDEGGGRDCCWY